MFVCVLVCSWSRRCRGWSVLLSHHSYKHQQSKRFKTKFKYHSNSNTNTQSKVSDMLESYERECRSLEGSLLEAEENLDNTRCAAA